MFFDDELPLLDFKSIKNMDGIAKMKLMEDIHEETENKINSHNKIFYTTGRLTSEMVIKSVIMEIPIVISRSGFTVWGVELARKANLTLIGRAKGKKFTILSGEKRIENK